VKSLTKGEDGTKDRPSFQVLERTFAILELFTEERPEWTSTEVARALELPIPTSYRILTALRELGYVHQDAETKRFRLGVAALALGERARSVVDLRAVTLPILRWISKDSGETALLTVPSATRDAGVCLERVETSQPLRLSVQPGRQLPLHAGASQKVLLAYMPVDEIEHVLKAPLEQLCESTITDPERMREEVNRIRLNGWASSYEETNVGVWGLATPLVDKLRGVVAAIGVAGPSARLGPDLVAEHVNRLHEGTQQVAGALGLEAPPVKLNRKAMRAKSS